MLTVQQVASVLSVSPALVYGLVSRGLLRCERYGLGRGTIRIPQDALDEYRERARVVVAEGRTTTPAATAPLPRLRHISLQPASPAQGGTSETVRGVGKSVRASTDRSVRPGAQR